MIAVVFFLTYDHNVISNTHNIGQLAKYFIHLVLEDISCNIYSEWHLCASELSKLSVESG